MNEIGDLCEVPKETVFKWKIKDFFSLSDEPNTFYDSPKFYFCGASWILQIFTNGQTKNESEGYINLYLVRWSSGSLVTANFSFSLTNINGKTYLEKNYRSTFYKSMRSGFRRFIKREKLIEIKSQLTPTDDLTVICTLKNTEENDVANSLFRRQQDVCDNLLDVYLKKKRTDFKIIFNDEKKKIFTHRMILETRSPVFAAMFQHDTKENQTGELSIDDIDRMTMHRLLMYMYCGEMCSMSTEEALTLYAAADKYDIKHVKVMCLESVIRNLSVDTVCDTIQFAELYQEEEVGRRAREYFRENADEILESVKWKNFAKENHDLSVELLGSLIKTLLPKKTVQINREDGNQ